MLLNGTQTESAPRTYFIPASSLKEKPPKSLYRLIMKKKYFIDLV